MKLFLRIATMAWLFVSIGITNALAQNIPFTPLPIIIQNGPQVAVPTQSQFSTQEMDQIFGKYKIRTGVYRLMPMHSINSPESWGGNCIVPMPRPGDTRIILGINVMAYFQVACGRLDVLNDSLRKNVGSTIAIFADKSGYYSIRSMAATIENKSLDYWTCATVARGVVFGPAAIDSMPCEYQNDSLVSVANDQIFNFVSLGSDIYEIRTAKNECLDVRDSGMGLTETIQWACNGQNNQKFKLVYIRPLWEKSHIEPHMKSLGYWYDNGLFWPYFKTPNINFTGTPYSNTITKRDFGDECQYSCLRDLKCVNWTYVDTDKDNEPLCYLRDNFSSPIRASGTMGGSIRH